MNVQYDETIFIRKMLDKAKLADNQQFPVFTDFLDLHEQLLLKNHHKDFLGTVIKLNGGLKDCERKMAAFHPVYMEEELVFPITVLSVKLQKNNASDVITHRDYLGALMNIGIKRSKLGDIIIQDDQAILFTTQQMATFIGEQLLMIKNAHTQIEIIHDLKDIHYEQSGLVIKGTVSSMRLDSIVKLGFSMSRGHALEMIESAKVFINSRCCEKASTMLKENDVISVRGYGKMRLQSIGKVTKKDRTFVELFKYL